MQVNEQKGLFMKKISAVAALCTIASGAAFAGFQPNNPSPMGGFVGGAENIVTVSQAKEMRDDTPVIVQGHIVQRMGDEKYLFEDSTGSITVEIDRKDWRGQTVTPSDMVKLYGEVDAGLFKTEIDVDYVTKM